MAWYTISASLLNSLCAHKNERLETGIQMLTRPTEKKRDPDSSLSKPIGNRRVRASMLFKPAMELSDREAIFTTFTVYFGARATRLYRPTMDLREPATRLYRFTEAMRGLKTLRKIFPM